MIFFNDPLDFIRWTLQVYRRDAGSGKLTLLEIHEDGVFVDLAISPDGRYVYVAVSDSVRVYSRVPSGALTLVAAYDDQSTGWGVFFGAAALAISADGSYVYLASNVDNVVAAFTRDAATGALGLLERHYDTGSGVGFDNPSSVALSPDGGNLYVGSPSDNRLTVFTRAVGTGGRHLRDGSSAALAAPRHGGFGPLGPARSHAGKD